MRKIEKAMLRALIKRERWASGNTRVELDMRQDGKPLALVFLHGNHIATVGYRYNGDTPKIVSLTCTLAGWNTPTTRSRINALTHLTGQPDKCGVNCVKGSPRVRPGKYGTDYMLNNHEWFTFDMAGD
jgi:hypothetical protein